MPNHTIAMTLLAIMYIIFPPLDVFGLADGASSNIELRQFSNSKKKTKVSFGGSLGNPTKKKSCLSHKLHFKRFPVRRFRSDLRKCSSREFPSHMSPHSTSKSVLPIQSKQINERPHSPASVPLSTIRTYDPSSEFRVHPT